MTSSTSIFSGSIVANDVGTSDLWRRWRCDNDVNARNALLVHYAPLVKWVANTMEARYCAGVERDDLIGWGMFGLIEAVTNYDPSRGVSFNTFAVPRIKGSAVDAMRRADWVPRLVRARSRSVCQAVEALSQQLRREPTDIEVADNLGVDIEKLRTMLAEQSASSLDALDAPRNSKVSVPGDAIDIQFDRAFDNDLVRQATADLPERERMLIELCYWEELSLTQIAEIFGVSESRVCQIHRRALYRLRNLLAALDWV